MSQKTSQPKRGSLEPSKNSLTGVAAATEPVLQPVAQASGGNCSLAAGHAFEEATNQPLTSGENHSSKAQASGGQNELNLAAHACE